MQAIIEEDAPRECQITTHVAHVRTIHVESISGTTVAASIASMFDGRLHVESGRVDDSAETTMAIDVDVFATLRNGGMSNFVGSLPLSPREYALSWGQAVAFCAAQYDPKRRQFDFLDRMKSKSFLIPVVVKDELYGLYVLVYEDEPWAFLDVYAPRPQFEATQNPLVVVKRVAI